MNVIYNTSPAVIGEQVQDLASQARKVGITMNLSSSNFDYMIANYNDPSSPKTISKWAMEDFGGFTNSTYPTTFGVFNSQGSSNLGGYTDPQADTLITASINSPNASAVTNEAAYLTTQQPGLFQPNPDAAFGTSAILVWQKTVSGTPRIVRGPDPVLLEPGVLVLHQVIRASRDWTAPVTGDMPVTGAPVRKVQVPRCRGGSSERWSHISRVG